MKYGFMKVASAIPAVKVGDVIFNTQQIEDLIAQAEGKGVEIITFPELSITGYSCQDLFRQQMLLDSSEQAVMMLLDFTRKLDIISIVGAPVIAGDLLLNCGIVIQHGQILGIVPKIYLPNYSEFYEKRWFASAQDLRDCEVRYAGHKVKLTPDVQIFRMAEEKWGMKPENTFMIGDSLENDIAGAKNAGWKTIWMNHHRYTVPEGMEKPDYIAYTEEELRKLIVQICFTTKKDG